MTDSPSSPSSGASTPPTSYTTPPTPPTIGRSIELANLNSKVNKVADVVLNEENRPKTLGSINLKSALDFPTTTKEQKEKLHAFLEQVKTRVNPDLGPDHELLNFLRLATIKNRTDIVPEFLPYLSLDRKFGYLGIVIRDPLQNLELHKDLMEYAIAGNLLELLYRLVDDLVAKISTFEPQAAVTFYNSIVNFLEKKSDSESDERKKLKKNLLIYLNQTFINRDPLVNLGLRKLLIEKALSSNNIELLEYLLHDLVSKIHLDDTDLKALYTTMLAFLEELPPNKKINPVKLFIKIHKDLTPPPAKS